MNITSKDLKPGDRVQIRGLSYAFQIVSVEGEYVNGRRVDPVTGALERGTPFKFKPGDAGAMKLGTLADLI